MLKKMLFHGLIAAAVIGAAAAVYATERGTGNDDGHSMGNAAPAIPAMQAEAGSRDGGNGYVSDDVQRTERNRHVLRESEHERGRYEGEGSERRRKHGGRDDD